MSHLSRKMLIYMKEMNSIMDLWDMDKGKKVANKNL